MRQWERRRRLLRNSPSQTAPPRACVVLKIRPAYDKLSAEGKKELENIDFIKRMVEIIKKVKDVVLPGR